MPGEHLLVIDDSPTLLKVVETTLTRAGYRVDTAADGSAGLSLVRGQSTVPDLILLDGVIPGSDPAEMCRELAGDEAFAGIPIVVMATKGDDLEIRFAKAPNVVDYISKPFSPDALQAVVSHVVDSRAGAPKAPGSGVVSGTIEVRPREGATGPTAASRAAVAEALSQSGSTETTASALGGFALAGDLSVVSLGEVLSMLKERSQSGVLRVVNTRTHARVELVFDEGRIDFAGAVGVTEEFLLGRFAVERGDVTAEALDVVLAERKKAKRKPPLFGADLVARGLLTPEQLKRAMVRQTSELVYETLRWTHGFFQLSRTTDAVNDKALSAESPLGTLARGAALAINIDRLLLEGYRRVDEWRVIERVVDNFDTVFVRDENKIAALPRGTFTREELAVLELVSGRLTVREIVRSLRLGSFDVSKVLFRLLRTKLIRPRIEPVPTI